MAARMPGGDMGEAIEADGADHGRWEEAVVRLIERAESISETSERTDHLIRAASIYETKLADLEKAGIILQTAFQDDVTNPELVCELARVTAALGRWGALIEDCGKMIARQARPADRATLLVAMAGWQKKHLNDMDAAERSLAEALAVDPSHRGALRAISQLYGSRGDWGRAAQHLIRAAEAVSHGVDKVALLLEAGNLLETRLGDRKRAAEPYRRALEISPGHAIATEALANIACENGDWAEAGPLLEALLAEYQARARSDRARLHRQLAHVAQATGDLEKAREHYRRSHELDPDDLNTLRDLAALAYDQKWWEDARGSHALLLARADADLEGAARADALERLARACLALGDLKAAADAAAKALGLVPDHRGCRQVALEASAQRGDAGERLQHRRALLKTSTSPDERFSLLCELARAYRDESGDADAATRTFVEALQIRPHDHVALHELLDLLTGTKQWKRAVELLHTLLDLETGKAKAKYLVAIANILNYELHAVDEAVEIYNRALDEDPDDLKTFERIDKILTAKRSWRDEARNYRRMIKRIGTNPAPEKKDTLVALWRGVGEIYRSRLKDLTAAVTAFEVCASLDPSDSGTLEIMAEIFELQGPPFFIKAVEMRTRLAQRAESFDALAVQLRALRRLYFDNRHYDRVFCVCAALVAMGRADPKERAYYERLAGYPLPAARAALTEELWQRCLYHQGEDFRISQLFAAICPSMMVVRAREVRAWGLDERRRVGQDSSPSLVPQLIGYAASLLGLHRPVLYLRPDVPGDIDVANVLEHGQPIPSLVVGRDLTRGRTEKEVAFIAGRTLAKMRSDHMVLWPNVVPSVAELRIAFLALLKMFQPAMESDDERQPAFAEYKNLFVRTLPPHALEPLGVIIPQLVQDSRQIDLKAWAAAADETAMRAGLLVCGDVVVAMRALRAGDSPERGAISDETRLGLLRWSVSLEYLGLREQMGLDLGTAAIPTRAVPQPKIIYR